jgi:hypothetical protein
VNNGRDEGLTSDQRLNGLNINGDGGVNEREELTHLRAPRFDAAAKKTGRGHWT